MDPKQLNPNPTGAPAPTAPVAEPQAPLNEVPAVPSSGPVPNQAPADPAQASVVPSEPAPENPTPTPATESTPLPEEGGAQTGQ